MLVVPAASVSADTAEGGSSFHYSQTGKGADAGWTTAPLDGSLVPGVVYTDTWITVSEAAMKQDGTVFSDEFVFVDQYRYKVDRSGNWTTVSETFGFAGGSDVSLAFGTKLSSASVTATVSLTTCTATRRGGFECVEAGTGSVQASWTAQGSAVKQSGTSHIVADGFSGKSSYRQTSRSAIASASLDGSAIDGQPFYASIFSATYRDIYVCHGPGTC
jgi:hypothetical protein